MRDIRSLCSVAVMVSMYCTRPAVLPRTMSARTLHRESLKAEHRRTVLPPLSPNHTFSGKHTIGKDISFRDEVPGKSNAIKVVLSA